MPNIKDNNQDNNQDEYVIMNAKHKSNNVESLFYGVFTIAFIYLGYNFIKGLSAYLSDSFNLTAFPVVYLLLWLITIVILIIVSAINIRRHLLISNYSVYLRQNGFNETEIPLENIISVETKKDAIIINTENNSYNYNGCANSEAIAKQIMLLKHQKEEE